MNNDTRICTKCNTAKPATPEYFYKGSTNVSGLGSWCKECMKALSKATKTERKGENIRDEGEKLAVAWLRSNGIPSDIGKNAGTIRWLDVLAWGCVKIEVKYSKTNGQGLWCWAMNSVNNKPDSAKPHIALFIGRDARTNQYHYFLFDINDPELFNQKTNTRKTNVTFNYQSKESQNREAFQMHENALYLVEESRLKAARELMVK